MALELVNSRPVFFGVLPAKDKFGSEVESSGLLKELRWKFDFDGLPVGSTAGDTAIRIPLGKEIISGRIVVITAMAGSSGTLTVGVNQADGGGAIDADGIDVAVAQAALIADAVIAADGALIGTKLAEDGQLICTTGGTVTAGSFEVILVVSD